MPHQIIVGSAVDMPILKFLWLWKAATSATLGLKFYKSPSSEACYKRLRRLAKAGFIRSKFDDKGQLHVWTLDKKGYRCIKAHFEPNDDGYKSEKLAHDLFVHAVHLGDWIHGIPEHKGIYTEQQLRRTDPDSYPEWLPNTDRHRPDGYWDAGIEGKSKAIALEVELSRKPNSSYYSVADFYASWKRIFVEVYARRYKSALTELAQKHWEERDVSLRST